MNNNKYSLYKKYIDDQLKKLNNIYKVLLPLTGKRKLVEYTNEEVFLYKSKELNKIFDKPIIDHKKYVSASKLKNYVFEDTLSDWLDEFYNKSNSYKTNNTYKTTNINVSQSDLFKKGIKFEQDIINQIQKKFSGEYVIIATEPKHSLEVSKFYDTLNAIKNNVPIIIHGVLHDNINKTFGVPDIIIRSDYLNKLVKEPITQNTQNTQNIFGGPHYVIIDIKFSTIYLKNKNKSIKNTPLTKYYKTQICLYNIILGIVQGYTPEKAYILAKNIIGYKKNIFTPFDKLAPIEYKKDDKMIIKLCRSAISWIIYMRTNGQSWDPEKPHIIELLPNIKTNNICSNKWYRYKKRLIYKRSDILEIWNCNTHHRINAIKNGIYCWRTQGCTAKILGIKNNNKTTKIINLMFKMNQHGSKLNNFYPNKIKNNYGNWKEGGSSEFFIDFETTSDDKNNYIFIIGLGYIKPLDNEWVYKYFHINKLNEDAEEKMLHEFFNFLATYKEVALYHWGHFEETTLNKKIKKYKFDRVCSPHFGIKYKFIDMIKIFKQEPIIIRGALNFGLKTIAIAMFENKFINVSWDNNNFTNGYEASNAAKKIYNTATSVINNIEFNNIIKYNETDCRVLYEILIFLRSKI